MNAVETFLISQIYEKYPCARIRIDLWSTGASVNTLNEIQPDRVFVEVQTVRADYDSMTHCFASTSVSDALRAALKQI